MPGVLCVPAAPQPVPVSCRLALASCVSPGWMQGRRAGWKPAAASAQACTSSHNTVRAERGPAPRGRDGMWASAVLSHTAREQPAASPPLGQALLRLTTSR